eukprot:8005524-Alexandrium_andersonii.AAC.1
MLDIIANTKKSIAAGRWMSHDPSLPNTVELWLRIFHAQMEKKNHDDWTDTQKSFAKYVAK